MSFEHKENSGSLFENERKERDSQPDWTGSAKIDGVDYRLAAWENEGRKGLYFSLKFTPKDEDQTRPGSRTTNVPAPDGFAERRKAAMQKARESMAQMTDRKSAAAGDDTFSDDDIPF